MSERIPPPPPPRDYPRPPCRRRRLIYAFVVPLASLIAMVVMLGVATRAMGWQPFRMPGGSMLPGVLRDDYFFVDRSAYADGRQPRRGDIVVYWVPESAGELARWNGRPVEFVDRVIGLPGERIEIRNGVPVIDGRPAVQTRIGDFDVQRGVPEWTAARLREAHADGATFEVIRYSRKMRAADGGPVTVPAGSFFVMGDNRDDALDSRAGWWFVPAANLIGRPNYVYWSGFERFGRMGLALK